MRFVLFSDLHLDSQFAWAPPPTARRRRQALRDALIKILALADEVEADAILCAGDLYEHERFTPDTAAFLQSTLGGTHRRVLITPGNHDWYGPPSLYFQVRWPANVTIFTEDEFVPLELVNGLVLWGAAHRAPANTGGFFDRGFRADGAGIHLAMFHGSELSGLPFETEGKVPHAPFDGAQISAAGLHHAFVGHYHQPRDAEYYTYPGNPDPLTFGETGDRGAVVVDINEDGALRRHRRNVSASQVHDLTLDVTGCASSQDIRDRSAQALGDVEGSVRLTLEGELAPEIDLRFGDLQEFGDHLDGLLVRRGRLSIGYTWIASRRSPRYEGSSSVTCSLLTTSMKKSDNGSLSRACARWTNAKTWTWPECASTPFGLTPSGRSRTRYSNLRQA